MQTKKLLYDTLLLIFVYVLVRSNFFYTYINNEHLTFAIKLFLLIAFLIFALYFIHRNNMEYPRFAGFKRVNLILLPLFLVISSNLLVVLFTGANRAQDVNTNLLVYDGILNLFGAGAEELVFRVSLLTYFLRTMNAFKALIYSSLVFGLIHLVNISSIASLVPVLTQVGYTFLLGLGCGLVYLVSENFVWPVLLHFLFNFINGTIIANVFMIDVNVMFYVINGIVAVILLAYGYFIWKTVEPKGEFLYAT